MALDDQGGLVGTLLHICAGFTHLQLNGVGSDETAATLEDLKGVIITLMGRLPSERLMQEDVHHAILRTGDRYICARLPYVLENPRLRIDFEEMVRIITSNPEYFFFLCRAGIEPKQNNGPFAELMSLMMSYAADTNRPEIWQSARRLLLRHEKGIMPLIYWARTKGNVDDLRVAQFVAGILHERHDLAPELFSHAIAFAVKRCKPFAVAALHLAGGRLTDEPDFIQEHNNPVLNAYASEHGRLQFEGKYGPLERFLFEFDEASFLASQKTT
jgi:hypothetical protein